MDREYSDQFLNTIRSAVELNDHQGILHNVYSVIIQGDFDALGEWMTEDVELKICGFTPINGLWRGRREVAAAARKNFAELESQQPEIECTIHQGDCTAVLVRESGVVKSTGQAYSIRGVQWFTFADGKISKIDQVVASIWK